MKASESPYNKIEWLSTGFSALDTIMGGGVPTRRITEFSGNYSVGKSTLALQIIARAQKQKRPCIYADSEFTFSADYASSLGVDCKKLELVQEEYGEATLDAMLDFARGNEGAVLVLDSVGSILPRQEAEKTSGEKTIGAQAGLIAAFCRRIVPILALKGHSLIVLNHQFIDIMGRSMKTSGGKKLEYAKSIWVSLSYVGKKIKMKDQTIGVYVVAEVRKNKLAPTSSQKCSIAMLWGTGFSVEEGVLSHALEKGVVRKSGNTFFFEEEKLGVGIPQSREYLKENTKALEAISKLLKPI